jgi:hypothetical protein
MGGLAMSHKFFSFAALVGVVACGSAGTTAHNPAGADLMDGGTGGSSGVGSSSGSGVGSSTGSGVGSSSGSGAGSSGGSSGAGSDASPPPHVVLPCPTDEAGAEVGVWEDITPAGLNLSASFPTEAGTNYGPVAFVIDPSNMANVYLGTSAQGIYKTTDCGSTWTKVNTGPGGTTVGAGRNGSMVIDAMNPNVLYTDGRYGPLGIFKTTDGGVSWTQIMVTNMTYIESIAMDPTNDQHIVVTPHFTCDDSSSCLMSSMDGGNTWTKLPATIASGELGGLLMLSPTHWLLASGALSQTTDGGTTWTTVHSGGTTYPFLYKDAAGTYFMPNNQNIISSTDLTTWTQIANSPASVSLAGGDSKIFAANQNNFNANTQYYSYAMVSAPTVWTNIPNPDIVEGGWMLQYDQDHHILYSSNFYGGFWRVRTQ